MMKKRSSICIGEIGVYGYSEFTETTNEEDGIK